MSSLKRSRARFFQLCLCVLAIGSVATAHDSEPINTEFASPLARRTANLNFDLQHFRGNPSSSLAGLDFEYGVANRMQFSAGMALLRVSQGNRSITGAGNLDLAYRYLLAGSNEKAYAISINPELELPTGNPGVTDTAYTVGASAHVDAHRGDRFWLHSNFGYQTPVANFVTKDNTFVYAVAAMYELTERWHPVLAQRARDREHQPSPVDPARGIKTHSQAFR